MSASQVTASNYRHLDSCVFERQLSQPNPTPGIIYKIVGMLELSDLVRVERLSRAWQKVATEPVVWQGLYEARFGLKFQAYCGSPAPWKIWYKCLHYLVREPKVGDIHDKNMPKSAKSYLGSDPKEIERSLNRHIAAGAIYHLSLLQGAREIRYLFRSLNILACGLKQATYEVRLNYFLAERICSRKVRCIVARVVNARNQAAEAELWAFDPRVVATQIEFQVKRQMPRTMDMLVDSMKKLAIREGETTEQKIWAEVQASIFEGVEPLREFHALVGCVKNDAGNPVGPKIYCSVDVLIQRQERAVQQQVEFCLSRNGRDSVARLKLFYDAAETSLMRCVCTVQAGEAPNLALHLEQLAYELALREEVQVLEIVFGERSATYTKVVADDGSIVYGAKDATMLDLSQKRFPKLFIDIEGRVIPTPRVLPFSTSKSPGALLPPSSRV